MSSFFCLAYFQDSLKLKHVSILHSFSMAEYYSIVCIYHNLFIHSSVDRHLNCFHLLPIVNSATMNVCEKAFKSLFSVTLDLYLGVELLGQLTTFNFLRKGQIVFHSGCTILLFHQQCRRILISLYSHQHLFFSFFFFLIAILVGMKWCLVSLLCISLMMHNTEHCFMCLLAICIFSLEKCLFIFSPHFLFGLFASVVKL